MTPDQDNLYICLGLRKGCIQTGEAGITAEDAVAQGRPEKVRPLTVEQMKLLIRIDELMQACLDGTLEIVIKRR